MFADNSVTEDEIYVNVQALSGAPANNAVYHALINPGETILGMTLAHGGHLSHGSPVNRSGKLYRAVHYSVDPVSERIDYDKVAEIAFENKPKIIVAGYSSYPWSVDWARFRKIAKDVGAYLLADISHVAGMVAAKIYPSPVGYADVVTFTTHKTLCGPRGACILAFDPTIAKKIDRAVFPGEQGGPHLNAIAGIAVAMKLAKSEQFIELQTQIVKNCIRFTDQLRSKGFRIPYGGTNTHLMNLDCSSIIGQDGTTLSGDQAARILDLAGIVVNRNTIPGDLSAVDPSGIRMGTTWITQRGFLEPEIDELSEIIYRILNSCQPFSLEGKKGGIRRAKIPFDVLENAKIEIRELSKKRPDNDLPEKSYTFNHFNYIDDVSAGERGIITLEGEKVRRFLDFIIPENIEQINSGDTILTTIYTPDRAVEVILKCSTDNCYDLSVRSEEYGCLKAWLNDLSDGYVEFGDDQKRKLPGPIRIRHTISSDEIGIIKEIAVRYDKPFVVGINQESTENFRQFSYSASSASLKRTPLFDTHKKIGAKIIDFAGWEMPVWYSSIVDEHTAVRQASGIFDVSHMGIFQIEGVDASGFLDSIVGNDIGALNVGQSCYTHFLDPDANVIDDLLVYRRGVERYLLVVNASNDEKDWAWINSVKEGNISVSHQRPGSRVYGRNIRLRNLRDPKEDREMRIDIALQGPKSRDILLSLEVDNETKQKILHLRRTELCEATVGKFQMIVSRTGYTGEKIAFELFVHPEFAVDLFNTLLDVGELFGIKPIGLGARDSLRTEAGLPLYGHEMGEGSGKRGFPDLGVSDAGFGSYVKTYKPWFVGREAYINKDKLQKRRSYKV